MFSNPNISSTDNDLQTIINYYGSESQLNMLIEECAELIQSIQKLKRYPDNNLIRSCLISELADVCIMMNQMFLMFDVGTQTYFNKTVDRKIKRQLKRIKQESEVQNEPN